MWIASRIGVIALTILLLGCGSSKGVSQETPAQITQLTGPTTPLDNLSQTSVNTTVDIVGKVKKHAPLLDSWLYQITDDTTEIWIMSTETPPEIGVSVRIRGVIQYEQILIDGTDIGEHYLQEASRAILDSPNDAIDTQEQS